MTIEQMTEKLKNELLEKRFVHSIGVMECAVELARIYGADEEFFRSSGNLMTKYLRRLKKLCDERNLILLEAHPFRKLRFRHNPNLLHGCEVYNGKDKYTDANRKAKAWAEKNGFGIVTSGGDFHHKDKTNPGGIITNEPVKTMEDLMRILRSGEYELIEA